MDDAGGGGPPARGRERSTSRKRMKPDEKLNGRDTVAAADVKDKGEAVAVVKGKSDLGDELTVSVDMTDISDRDRRQDDRPVYRYDESHKGPFMVYVDSFDVNGVRKYLNGIAISRLLMNLKIEDVVEVFKIGYGRVKVTFKNYKAANNFADDKRIIENGLSVRIFAHFVSKMAIVFDIPTEISEEEFIENVVSPIEIQRCIRIVRKGKESEEVIPSRNMKIVFKGSEIPREVQYGYIKIPVKHYIAFAQCYRCYRYNHYAQHCKQNMELCRDCFNQHSKEVTCGAVICVNCKGDHPPTLKACPARVKAFALKKMMTIENLSIKEARNRYASLFTNRFSILEDVDTQFPALNDRGANVNRDNHQDAVRHFHRAMPYAKVARIDKNKAKADANTRELINEHQRVLKDHEINLSYNLPKLGEIQQTQRGEESTQKPTRNYNNILNKKQTKSKNHEKAMDFLLNASQEAGNFLKHDRLEKINMGKLRDFLYTLKDDLENSMNYLDADMVNWLPHAGN